MYIFVNYVASLSICHYYLHLLLSSVTHMDGLIEMITKDIAFKLHMFETCRKPDISRVRTAHRVYMLRHELTPLQASLSLYVNAWESSPAIQHDQILEELVQHFSQERVYTQHALTHVPVAARCRLHQDPRLLSKDNAGVHVRGALKP